MGSASNSAGFERLIPDHRRTLYDSFARAGQAQVFRFLPLLTREERTRLFDQANAIDLAAVGEILGADSAASGSRPDISPLPPVARTPGELERYAKLGRDLLAKGKVAFLTVAGGQATRLGLDAPKGCFPISPFDKKTLFAWHAEKVHAVARRYGSSPPWVILLSDATEGPTRSYFEENGYHGLKDRIRFIRQEMLPVLDDAGRILLSTPGEIALAPNGHGGVLQALADSGTIDWLREAGVEELSYFQVDNALLSPADPVFLGLHRGQAAEMSAKVVRKRSALEAAGVMGLIDGSPGVIEYSELPEDMARARDAEGELLYGLINIAAHLFSLDFLTRAAGESLPHHCAVKEVATVDEGGAPTRIRGRKFETFVFDAIPLARNFQVFETDRAEEFSPLKNREGVNSPETVRADLLARARRWYAKAEVPLPGEEGALEISPMDAYDLETFLEWVAGVEGRSRP